ncbi:hypothetical protein [Spiroplasma endosymbiont of Virgichneumon dumeticola]|uniref:hypothetical protein n=1 Tax=Spiroplasma endosymbiont of Virgichneumon dumeticola TaxID=3139323 RepID=UPI0035C8A509
MNSIENSDGNIKSFNWTIVYEKPLINGGTKMLANLKPLNVNNAIKKGTDYPKWKTAISYNGTENYAKEKT